MPIFEIRYRELAFKFELTGDDAFEGRSLLDADEMALLAALMESESEDWCLDGDGERLPAEQLFHLSPWSYN